jgi:hypothetical protein
MMTDNRSVIINGRVAFRLLCEGFSGDNKGFITITRKAFALD